MKNLKIAKKKGFSLVELLVVIAVIGVIAAIAIPAMTNVFGSSRAAKARRNAQSLASAYAAALAAGAPAAASELAACDAVIAGMNGSGQFSTSVFRVQLDDAERDAAMTDYLSFDNNTLTYTGTDGDLGAPAPAGP